MKKQFQLFAKSAKNGQRLKSFEVVQGRGEEGAALRIQAESGTRYELFDAELQRAPDRARAKRAGRHLEIFFEGSAQADVVIENYYDEAIVEFPKDSLVGQTAKGDIGVYVIDEGLRPALTTLLSEVTPIVLSEPMLLPWWSWGAVGLGVAALGGGSADASAPAPAPAIPDLVIQGSVTAGPVKAGMTIQVFDKNGNKLGETSVDASGHWKITKVGMGDYRGAVLVKATDSNGNAVNYTDEVTGTDKSLSAEQLRAMGLAQVGNAQFVVEPAVSTLTIHITPMTEVAVRAAGITADQAPAQESVVTAANSAIAKALGLSGLDITATQPLTTNAAAFDSTDPQVFNPVTGKLAPAAAYGLALAKLSGLDAVNGGSVDATIAQLTQHLDLQTGQLSAEGAALVDQGRKKALDNLKAGNTTFNAGGSDPNVNTRLNRQLLGDAEIVAQSSNAAGQLSVQGTALPGSTVIVTLPDGTQQSTVTDALGNFSLTSTTAQPLTNGTLKLVAQDALTQPVVTAPVTVVKPDPVKPDPVKPVPPTPTPDPGPGPAPIVPTVPGAPVADIAPSSDTGTSNTDNITRDNTPTIAGTGTAGDTITVTLPGTHEVLTTTVASNGTWSVTPTQALADGTANATVIASNTAGTSPATLVPITIDTTPPAVPTVTAQTSNTLTPIIQGTAVLAAGEHLTVTVNGATYAVVPDAQGRWSVNTATATPISGTLAAFVNGQNYSVTATVTDAAGNTSIDNSAGELTINTSAPSVTLPEAPLGVNAAEAASIGGTPLAISLPSNAQAGDTVTSVVTKPDGSTITLTTLLDPTDIVNGAIEQVIATADLNLDGVWLTSTTITPNGGSAGPAAPGSFVLDTTAPAAPAADMAAASDTGLSHTDNVTADNTPTIAGTGTPGDTITVTMPGTNEVLITTVAANGSWSVTPTQALADGTANASVTATDPAGNTSAATSVPVTIDTTPPAAPAADVATASDTGASNTDNITRDTTPTISGGSATPGDTITVTFPTGEVLTTTVANDGSWSVTPTQALPDGLQSVSVTATDPAGNTSAATSVPVTIDTTPPAAPAADLATASDTGTSPTDNITNDTTPTIDGTGTPGDTITVTFPSGEVLTTTVANDGSWSVTPSTALSDGLQTVSVTATDPAGNVSAPTSAPVTIDTTANVPTVVPTLGNTLTPTLTGGANLAPGESLTVAVGGATYAVTPDAQGVWTLDLATAVPVTGTLSLANGTHNVTATITDAAGNTGTDTSTGELTIDTGRIAVTLPEAPNGVNAAEAASAGGTPLVCGLPVGAVAGDVVTTVVTPPGSATPITLTTTLSAADIAAGTITQLIPSSDLSTDGNWTTSTTLSHNGTAGTATPGSFTLDTVAPNAPAASLAAASDTGTPGDSTTADNTPTITGAAATPGDTITVTLPSGEVLTTVVAPNGSWSVTPTQALPDGAANVTVTATDPAGNTSVPTTVALTIDTTAPAAPAVAIPEAAAGVSALEAADGVQLTVTLPADARVGDVVTTTVTAPNGSTSTLSYTVQAADVPAAQGGTASGSGPFTISQTVPLATLKPSTTYLDGAWTTSSTLTDPAGNVSPAMADGFTLAATAPTISIATVAGDNTLNALEASGAVPVTGTTTAEAGQTVTVQLLGNGNTVLGTFTATVQPDGSFSLSIPQASLPADGSYSLTADVSNTAGTPAVQASQALLIDTTAPTITVTSIAGDTIDATHLSGEFSALERGSLGSNAVTTPPVISGTTTAEPGQTVQVTVDGHTYSATVQNGGTWSVQLSNADALSLGHGSSYPITVSTTDAAGNTGSNTATSLLVNIATPDIPTVVEQYTASHTPTINGAAQKISGSNYIALDNGDLLTVTVNNVSYSLTVGATSSPAGLTYSNGSWALVPASIPNGHYEVAVSVTAGGVTQSDISTAELHINDAPPAIAIDPISGGTLNAFESTQALPISGTTDAPVGSTVTLSLGGHSYTALVQAGGTYSVTVPGADAAALANGTLTATASVTNAYGLTGTGTQSLLVDTVAPGAATVVIPEGGIVNAAEAASSGGTLLNITLPTGAQVGDVVSTNVTQPDGSVLTLSTTLTAANITAGSISQLIPTSALTADGVWTTSTTVTDTAGNTGSASAGSFTLDTTAPAAPSAVLDSNSDSGLAGDSVTNDTTPTLSGAGVPGDTITVQDAAGNVIATATVAADGTWAATPTTALADGLHTFSVTATDPAGNVSAPTSVPVTIDTTANVPTVVSALANTLTPTLTGGANLAPGESLTVAVGGATYAVTPDAQGVWTLDLATAVPTSGSLTLLTGNSYDVVATITDAAGNTGTDTSTGELTIDTGRIAVALPEAANGVNAAEAASAGGTPLVCGLPVGAVAGDVVTTVVTPPGSATPITLTTTLTAADIAAGTITQLIPSSQLTTANNGSWTTSTTLSHNGTAGTATPGSFTLDTVAPNAPAASLAAASDTGTLGDSTTADNTPTIAGGSATPGDTITVTLPTGEVLTAVVDANGTWSVTPTQALPNGVANISVTATDPAGNTSAATPLALTIDTVAPAAPAADVATASDTGASNTDNITRDTTPTISGGSATPGDTITVTFPTGEVLTTTVASDGSWSVTPLQALSDGTANVSVTATDAAGNTSAPTNVPVTIDTVAPAAPAADVLASSDTGTSNTDNLTSDSTPTIGGAGATPGDTITVTFPTGEVLSTTVASDGSWSVAPSQPLANGAANLSVTATDPAGNTSPATTVPVTIDTTAPAAPAADVATASDTGASNTDNITRDTTPTISGGSATPGDTITVTFPSGEVLTTTVANDGSWSVTPLQALSDGAANVSVTATDPAGNTSAPTTVALTIDTTAPGVPTVTAATTSSITPTINGTASVAAGETLTVTVGGATFAVVPNAQGQWSLNTASAVPTSGSLGTLVNGQTYSVTATVTDAAGNASTDTSTGELTIDTSLPATPAAPDLTAATDSGASDTDNLTNDNTPDFAVAAPPAGGTLVLYVDGVAVPATYANGVLTPNSPLSDGVHSITTAVQVGSAVSAPSPALVVTIDTVVPVAATALAAPDMTAATDSGNTSDNITSDTTPDFAVTAPPADATLVLLVDGQPVAATYNPVTGTLTPSSPLTDGVHTITYQLLDAAGNTSAASPSLSVTISGAGPATPAAPDLTAATDSGVSTDNLTNDSTPSFAVTAPPAGGTVQLYVDGQPVAATYDSVTGTLTPNSALSDGAHTITYTLADAAGTASAASPSLAVTIDTTLGNPSVTIAEAAGGVNATEAANGVQLAVALPAGASVGDVVTTVVTGPGGVSITLTTTLQSADITAGTITQTVPYATVHPATSFIDGAWTTSTTLADTAGNTSAVQASGFTLAANTPTVTIGTVAGDNTVNAAEATGAVAVSGSTTFIEPGQTVTVQLMSGSTALHTYTATVQADGSYTLNIPSADLPADGNYSLTANASNTLGVAAAQASQVLVVDTTAPVITVTSVAGDTIDSTHLSGEFGVAERGSLPNNADLTKPVISGTTTAEVGQTMTVLMNGQTFTTTVQNGGTWSVELTDAQAIALSHGTTYAIRASVSDVVGNTGTDTDNSLVANIANPDTPTVVAQYTASHTPTITGQAKKNVGSFVSLDAGNGSSIPADVLTVTVNSVTYTLTIGTGLTGTVSTNGGLSYDSATSTWSLVPATIPINGNYEVTVSATAGGGSTKTDISTTELHINDAVPTITLNTISGGTLNAAESTQALPISGTTDAPVGSTVTVNIGGTNYTATVQVGGTFAVTVPGTAVAALADGTETVSASVTNAYGATGTDTETLLVDTTAPSAPPADVAAASDTGTSNTDNITSDSKPIIAGTGTDGDTITVVMPGTGEVLTTTVANGTWSVTPALRLADGSANVRVTATDPAGNTSAATTVPVTIDTTAPAAPVLTLANDNVAGGTVGALSAGALTNDNTPTLTFTAEAGSTVQVYDGATLLGTATEGPAGTFTYTPSALTDGAHSFTATSTDAAGNTSAPTTAFALTIDTAPPAIAWSSTVPATDNVAGGIVGTLATGNATNDSTPTLTFTAAAGSTVQVYDGATLLGTATEGPAGAFTYTPSGLSDGAHSLTATATDSAGNSATTSAFALTVDTAPPATPVVTTATSTSLQPVISGTATVAAGETLKVVVNGATYTVVPDAQGNWSIDTATATATPTSGTLGTFAAGQTYNVTASTTDAAGNISTDTTAGELTIAAVTLTGQLDVASDSGAAGDSITNDTTPTISGQGLPGQTIKLYAADGTTLLGTAVVPGTGVWSITPTTALADGLQNLQITSTDSSNVVTGPVAVPVTIDASAPVVTVTSAFADTVDDDSNTADPSNGTFDGTERGITIDSTTNGFTFNTNVSPEPVISGTASGADGRTLTLNLNGQTYTTTVQTGGAWSVTVPSADAQLLNHGNTYTITASVTDVAGNTGADVNNGVTVNIAPPDVPTVVSQVTQDTTPLITGVANKIDNGSTVPLATGTGDTLTVVIKDTAGTALQTYNLTIGGTSSPAGLTYSSGTWSLQASTLALGTYNVDVSSTAGGLTRTDISSTELKVVQPVSITSIPEATSNSVLNSAEAANGTTVNVNLTNSGAVAGDVIRIMWDGQPVDVVLTAADIAANTVAVPVPQSVLQTATPANTTETLQVSAALISGTTTISTSANSPATVNFVTPTAPTINNVAWAATGAGASSTVLGIGEANYAADNATALSTTGNVDNALYVSEAYANGTVIRVQLPMTATLVASRPVAGDTVVITWGDQTYEVPTTLTGTNITNKWVDVVVPYSVIKTQDFGSVVVSSQIKSAVSGNLSAQSPTVTIDWKYDVPVGLFSSTGGQYGFAINGELAGDYSGYAVANAGDVNGDGFDDIVIGAPGNDASGASAGRAYVVFGGTGGYGNFDLSQLSVAGNSLGFVIKAPAAANAMYGFAVSGAGDINGDGLADVVVGNRGGYTSDGTNRAIELTSTGGGYGFVVFGRSSTDAVNLSGLSANSNTDGFMVSNGFYNGWSVTNAGDMNGDGLDDLAVTSPQANSRQGIAYVVYGKTSGNVVVASSLTGSSDGFAITGGIIGGTAANLASVSSGDVNGDGLSDLIMGAWYTGTSTGSTYVLYGNSNNTVSHNVTLSAIDAAGSTLGFRIKGEATNPFITLAGVADVNGDGLDDVLLQNTRSFAGTNTNPGVAWVAFGKKDAATISVSAIEAGSYGFAINAGLDANNNGAYSVASAGDVNGDGLGDLIVTHTTANPLITWGGSAYVVYGKTSGSMVNLSNIAPSLGFRILGESANDYLGTSAAGAGDINGDGFDDIVVGAGWADPGNPARSGAGKTYVIYGGATDYRSAVFQSANGDAVGTTGADTLSGTSGNNQLVGGDGNDILTGAGGSDVLYGGRGNDTLVINADNVAKLALSGTSQAVLRIDGGTGIDTLKIDGTGVTTNLATMASGLLAPDPAIFNYSPPPAGFYTSATMGTIRGQSWTTTNPSGQFETNTLQVYGMSAASQTLADGTVVRNTQTAFELNAYAGDNNAAINIVQRAGETVRISCVAMNRNAGEKIFVYLDGVLIQTLSGMPVGSVTPMYFDLPAPSALGTRNLSFYSSGTGGTGPVMGNFKLTSNLIDLPPIATAPGATVVLKNLPVGAVLFDGTSSVAIVADDPATAGVNESTQTIDVTKWDLRKLTLQVPSVTDTPSFVNGSKTIVYSVTDIKADGSTVTTDVNYTLGSSSVPSLPDVGMPLDLIKSIERIDLGTHNTGTGNTLSIGLKNVLDMSNDNVFNTASGWTQTSGSWTQVSDTAPTTWGATNRGNQIVVDGGSADKVVVDGAFIQSGTVTHTENGVANTYRVLQSTTAQAQILVDSDVQISLKPTIYAGLGELGNKLLMSEANSGGGTVIRVAIANIGATADVGQQIQLMFGQTPTLSAAITAADLSNGYIDVTVPTATLAANAPAGNIGSVPMYASLVSISNGFTTLRNQGPITPQLVDFVSPATPTISTTTWSPSGPANASSLSGVGEAQYAADSATFVSTGTADGVLWNSEILGSGTVIRVQLPTTATNGVVPPVAGDVVRVSWGGGTPVDVTITSAMMTAKYVDVTVPEANIRAAGYGDIAVTAQIVQTATGNGSGLTTQIVPVAFDLPLALPASTTNPTYGYAVNGAGPLATVTAINNTRDAAGGGVTNMGDLNGDGFDDYAISDSGNSNIYVAFGQSGNQALNLSSISAGQGGGYFIDVSSGLGYGPYWNVASSDVNGDGLNDLMVGLTMIGNDVRTDSAYVIYGKSTTTAIALSTIENGTTPALGFKVRDANYPGLTNPYGSIGSRSATSGGGGSPNNIGITSAGDVNGDGFEDYIFGEATALTGNWAATEPGRAFVLYGTSAGYTNTTLPFMSTNPASMTNGFFINGNTATGLSLGASVGGGGDVNGDGLDDLVVSNMASSTKTASVFVVYGKNNGSTLNVSSMTTAGSTDGFQIINAAQTTSSAGVTLAAPANETNAQLIGDVNGDGLADIAVSMYDRAVVVFGKATSGTVDAAAIAAGTSTDGFVIKGDSAKTGAFGFVVNAGDMNGDGLADMVVATGSSRAYVVFGQTAGATAINLTAPDITKFVAIANEVNSTMQSSISNVGDINGDGFDDIAIGIALADPAGGTNFGKTYVVYGGFSDVTSAVFQVSNGDVIGTSGADTINGTSGANQLVGAAGDDVITGNGGADVMLGGAGNDTFVLNADNVAMLARNSGNTAQNIARVNGGTGLDVIKLDGAGITLDLTVIRNDVIEQVENLDITGSGSNTVKLTAQDVWDMGDNNIFNVNTSAVDVRKQLMVTGDADDKVVLSDLTGWTKDATASYTANGHTYDVWNNNTKALQLLIDHAILQSNITAV